MKALIVVDMQNDFIDEALGTKEARAIVPYVTDKVKNFNGKVLFTKDTHFKDYFETLEGKKLPVKHCIEEDGMLKPFTRDTFSSCIKATYAEIDGKSYNIFKDPKTDRDTGHGFKKSQRGRCIVLKTKDNSYSYEDGFSWTVANDDNMENELKPIFRNGKLLKEYALNEVRQTLNGGKF